VSSSAFISASGISATENTQRTANGRASQPLESAACSNLVRSARASSRQALRNERTRRWHSGHSKTEGRIRTVLRRLYAVPLAAWRAGAVV